MFRFSPRELTPAEHEALDRLLSLGRGPKYALGRNVYSASVAAAVALDGIIDDFTTESSFQGLPVVKTTDVSRDAVVVSCVVDARPLTALRRLRDAGIRANLDYFTLTRRQPGRFRPVAYFADSELDIAAHPDRYEWLHQRLADDESREILRKVVAFRATGDLRHMEGFSCVADRQYFEPFLRLGAGTRFADGGGFDGQTVLDFHRHCPDHGAVHYFEPSAATMATAQRRLACVPDIEFIQQGLFDHEARLRFDSSAGPASRLCEEGGDEIAVTTLDSAVQTPVDFLKLDVEGAECSALRGAARHIREDHPALAVCVYHRQSDFWEVPQIVLSIRDDYDVYLRHYTEGVLETVMFFIPRSAASRHDSTALQSQVTTADKVHIEWSPNLSVESLTQLLNVFGDLLPDPLAGRVNTFDYARKLHQRALIAVARIRDEIIGILGMYANDRDSRVGFVTILAIHPDHQGKGLGRKIMAEAIEKAIACGMSRLRIKVVPGNLPARKLYASFGFTSLELSGSKVEMELIL